MAQFPNTTAADGIWTLKKVRRAILGDNWPAVILADQFFANTVLLLQADDVTDGSQNNTFLDSSTNTHTITRNGNVTQGSFSPFSQDEGKWGNYFDGTGDDLVIGSDASFAYGTGDFTWEFWVYITEDPATGGTYILDHGSNGGSLIVEATAGGTVVRYYNSTTGSSGSDLFDGAVLTMNAWNHVVACRESGTTRLFVNGVLGKSGADSHNYGTQSLTIGDYGSNGYSFAGQLSNLRLVKGTAVYTSAFTPSTIPLTAITNTSLLTCQSNRFVDNSSNAHSITVNGDPEVTPFSPFAPSTAYDPATKGGSGYFDGNGDYLVGASDSSYELTGDFTVELWYYRKNNNTNEQGIFGLQPAAGTSGLRITDRDDGKLWCILISGSGTVHLSLQSTNADSLVVNSWNHIAFTRSGSDCKTFINGVLDKSGTSSSWTGTGLSATIGAARNYASGSIFYTKANISNVRVIKGSALYTSAFTPPTAPLTAVSGTSLLCNFTNAGIYDGTGRNVLETVGNAQVDTAVKKYGTGSMQFDGTGDYLTIPDSSLFAFGSGDFTIEAWIYANSLGSFNGVIGQWPDNGGSANNSFVLETVGTDIDFYWVSGTTVYSFTDIGSIALNQWIHVAVARNGNSIYGFINGSLAKTGSITQTLNDPSSAITVGGNIAGGGGWNGYIDDLRITKGVARYTANFTPPAAKLEQQ